MSPDQLPINIDRLWSDVETISGYTKPDEPWTRRAFSQQFLDARDWLKGRMEQASLTVEVDAAANLIGRLAGDGTGKGAIVSGSHCDTVVAGGRFDGIAGVLAALEVSRALQDAGKMLRHGFEVVDFLSEEPSDFGVSCIGSRAISGMLEPGMLASRDNTGDSLQQALTRIGGNPLQLGSPLRARSEFAAFVELHIEQGPVLEAQSLPIGVVTHIVGIRRVAISVRGRPDHAGTTPMTMRKDALVGAAILIESSNKRARALSGKPHYVVATIGRIDVKPNVPNAVPGVAEMTLEIRSDSEEILREFAEFVLQECEQEIAALGLDIVTRELSYGSPTRCASEIIDCVERSAQALSLRSMRMPSGAGHDAVYMSKLCPTGMIFVPCLAGRSHCPEEWLEPEQLLAGTRVLAQTILTLDKELT